MVVNALLGLLGILFIYYIIYYIRDLAANKGNWGEGNVPINLFIGFITNFLDTFLCDNDDVTRCYETVEER